MRTSTRAEITSTRTEIGACLTLRVNAHAYVQTRFNVLFNNTPARWGWHALGQSLHPKCPPNQGLNRICSPSTRSDPLYHKRLRGQIAPNPRFVKMVDLRCYYLVQSERPASWSFDRYPGSGDISSKPRVSYGRGARRE